MGQLWGALRWVVAVVGLALVVVFAARGAVSALDGAVSYGTAADEEPAAASPTPSTGAAAGGGETVPLEDEEAAPVADSSIVAGTVQNESQAVMVIGPGADDGALLAFPGIVGSAACLEEVLLSFEVLETAMAVEMGAYVSEAGLTTGTPDGTPITGSLVSSTSPVGRAAVTDAGAQVIDVTSAFETGADAGAVTFALVPTELGVSDGRLIEIASSEAAQSPPSLSWTLAETCQ